ncbi:MAG: glycoside hydrolase family 32 protein [Cyclobacteriaceae bacterium]
MKNWIWIILPLLAACGETTQQQPEHIAQEEPYYQEAHRPQYHFSPEEKWMNDPNGMFYYEGEYHLFYQYYPDSTVWGPMHWGHAISNDLVTWEHLPIALYPDELGLIFSGSAVVDWNNTSGFGVDDRPPLIAIYTYHDMEAEQSGMSDDFQYQGIAYSNDKGRSWTKYEGNPVLPNQGIRDFRDPKVMWYEPSQSWIMTLAVKDHVEFYESPDLISWSKLSDFGIDAGAHGGVWECPDLFEMETDDGQLRWVLLVSINPGGPNGGSATQYFVGDFDGTTFTNEYSAEKTLWLDYGTDNYAGVTWSDIPEQDGRRLFIGWMSNWNYARLTPTVKWRSAMTVTRELEMVENQDGEFRVTSWPIMEYKKLATSTQKIQDDAQYKGYTIPLRHDLLDITLDIDLSQSSDFRVSFYNDLDDSVHLSYDKTNAEFSVDRGSSGVVGFEEGFAKIHTAPYQVIENEMQLRIMLDWSSIETFVDGGMLTMTEQVFPEKPFDQLIITSSGKLGISSDVSKLKSIWP